MKKNISLIILVVLVSFRINSQGQGPLDNLVVIIDPPHGGKDYGTNGYLAENKLIINESSYCYDIALRVEIMLKNEGALVFKTLYNKMYQEPIYDRPNEVIMPEQMEVFSFDGSEIKNDTLGLSKRTSFGNQKLKEYPGYKVVYISIHFDNLPSNYKGARIIKGNNSDSLSNCLTEEFQKRNLLSKQLVPVIKNGDKKNGIKNLYVLKDLNRVPEKVLIELGNIKNGDDLNILKNPYGREFYAITITRALEKYMNKGKN